MEFKMTTPETKECPFCAETIKYNAIICRYCQQKLPVANKEGTLPDQQPLEPNENKQPATKLDISLPSIQSAFQKFLQEEIRKDNHTLMKAGILSGIVFLLIGVCIVFSSFESVHITKLAIGLVFSAIGIFMFLHFGSKR